MVDGLKTSLRKILYCAFKRNLTKEIKVAQFSGYVSENSAYHHGEASLNGAIVNMAQNFVGSNNIHLLKPLGQFGTRLQGGDDSASERYIFTMLNEITRKLFPVEDDGILRYLDDDGTPVEPDYYVPIIPFVLVNGISGIGTGFSCNIPSYNPKDLITYIRNKLLGHGETPKFVPYYQGFRGRVVAVEEADTKFLIRGVYEKIAEDKIRITELPVGTWTMPYVTFLEGLMDPAAVDKNGKKIAPTIKDFVSVCTEIDVDIVVQFPKGDLAKLEAQSAGAGGINGVEKLLKLTTTVSTTNMHLFDANGRLKKYRTVEEIIDEYFGIRMDLYTKRKAYMVKDMRATLLRLSNKAKYILETLDDLVDLRRKTTEQVNALLESRGYDRIDGDYKYLVKMPMDSVTKEQVDKALKEKAETEVALQALLDTTEAQMWMRELDALRTAYDATAAVMATTTRAGSTSKTGKKGK
jgi:DNA topoisomerase-2